MTPVRRDRLIVTLGAWLVASLVAMLLVDTFSLQGYFVVSFLGLLSVMQLYAPTEGDVQWWLPLRGLIVVCFAVFGYVVYLRVVSTL